MIVREIQAQFGPNASKIYDYTVNPYTGCAHSCSYCYARFMKRFTGHPEPWGEFVDVKINAPDLLSREIRRKTPGTVWVSGVCDPYQPVEAEYRADPAVRPRSSSRTAGRWWCRRALRWWSATWTSSRPAADVEVGLSVTTADDAVRRLFEPKAPPIPGTHRGPGPAARRGCQDLRHDRAAAPRRRGAAGAARGKVDHVLIDRMNYGYGAWVYRKYGLEDCQTGGFFRGTAQQLASAFQKAGIPARVVF